MHRKELVTIKRLLRTAEMMTNVCCAAKAVHWQHAEPGNRTEEHFKKRVHRARKKTNRKGYDVKTCSEVAQLKRKAKEDEWLHAEW